MHRNNRPFSRCLALPIPQGLSAEGPGPDRKPALLKVVWAAWSGRLSFAKIVKETTKQKHPPPPFPGHRIRQTSGPRALCLRVTDE